MISFQPYNTSPAHPDHVRVGINNIQLALRHSDANRMIPFFADSVASNHLLSYLAIPALLANAFVSFFDVFVIKSYSHSSGEHGPHLAQRSAGWLAPGFQ